MFRQKIKHISEKYERYISSIALFLGFVLDNLTFQRIDVWISNVFLFFYLGLAMGGIVFSNLYDVGKLRGAVVERIYPWIIAVMQYAFGGLFSGYFIFYSRSGSLSASWLFIVILIILLVGNEVFKKRYLRFRFQVSILYVALFAFTIFYIPILLGTLGTWVFVLSGVVSLVCIALFIYGMSFLVPQRVRESGRFLMTSIGSIYVAIMVMYVANIIPPIPLSLKEAYLAHHVEKIPGGNYQLTYEEAPWYDWYRRYYRPVYHLVYGEPVYFYSAVFSPTNLDTDIMHRWFYYDTIRDEWVLSSEIRYTIYGGSDGGYRGYSFKEHVFVGRWRIDVVTPQGQRLGRYSFQIAETQDPIVTKTRVE